MKGLTNPLNYWLPIYQINTEIRIAHFLAQSCVETSNFSSLTEYTKNGGMEYEPSTKTGKAVGNKYPGDGPKYVGRGMLHLTGRENYDTYGKILRKDLIKYPNTVANDPNIAVRTAYEFWKKKLVNHYADKDHIRLVTYAVNGGYNGLSQRQSALEKIKK
ncbi:glycoside hydrolase family 19 protein [Rosenbergiella australiborealis]|uniref:glycoside hydrolase family 19 protein n=1 Tax=Rosenbergiella australiborealis TaxID=1544696 RepID=UPI001F4EEA16|nr:glycoside hydrolase family 19 protein [Rosenbergiella australiborealis]